MSDKIDWRALTRDFILGESGEDETDVSHDEQQENPSLLNEAMDRKLLIKYEASRIRNEFNSAEIDLLIVEIKNS